MLLTLLGGLKDVLPTCLFVGSSVPFAAAAVSWRLLSAALPKRWYVAGDDKLYECYQRMVLFVFEKWSGVQVKFYGDYGKVFSKRESAVYICNHRCTVDWSVVNMLAVRQGTMGHVRYMLKESLQYLPLYGWYFYQRGCVFVRRGGRTNYDALETQLVYLKSLTVPFWLVIYPEGTRFYRPNERRSISRTSVNEREDSEVEQPAFSNVLPPKVAGLKFALDNLVSVVDAVYDVTIAYESSAAAREFTPSNRAPSMWEFASGCTSAVHVRIDRIPIDQVPRSNNGELQNWLYERFAAKDRLLDRFFNTDVPNLSATDEETGNGGDTVSISTVGLLLPTAAFGLLVSSALLGSASVRRFYFVAWLCAAFAGVAAVRIQRIMQ